MLESGALELHTDQFYKLEGDVDIQGSKIGLTEIGAG